MNAEMRQATPLTHSAAAAELVVNFPRPTLPDAILTAAFLLPRAALASCVDDGGAIWCRANVTPEQGLEVWYRPGGQKKWKLQPLLGIDRLEIVPAPAGVRSITARVCNRLVLPLAGVGCEFRRGTPVGEAVQSTHELLGRTLLGHRSAPPNQLDSNFMR